MKRAILFSLFAALVVFAGGDALAQTAEPTFSVNLGTGDGLTARGGMGSFAARDVAGYWG